MLHTVLAVFNTVGFNYTPIPRKLTNKSPYPWVFRLAKKSLVIQCSMQSMTVLKLLVNMRQCILCVCALNILCHVQTYY